MVSSADSLRVYLTGAVQDGDDQDNIDLSLGNARSRNEVQSVCFAISANMAGIEIMHASGSNGAGLGTLRALDASHLCWTAPSGLEGLPVEILNGQTVTIPSANANQFLRVRRISATALSGKITVQLRNDVGNLFRDGSSAGTTDYRCVCFKNTSATTITNLVITCDAGFKIAQDAFASDYTEFSGTQGPNLNYLQSTTIASLSASQQVFCWIKRTIAAGTAASALISKQISWTFSQAGTYSGSITCQYRIADSTLDRYEIYRGVDGPVSYASPFETFTTLPHVTAALAASHRYRFVLRKRNRYGLLSQNLDTWSIELDAQGNQVFTKPSAPVQIEVTPATNGAISVKALYFYLADGDDAATEFLIYLTSNGANPDPAHDTPIKVSYTQSDGIGKLDWSSSNFIDETTIKCVVRTRRYEDSVPVDSANSDVYTCIADTTGPAEPELTCNLWSAEQEIIWQHDASNYISYCAEPGAILFVLNNMNVAGFGASRAFGVKEIVETELTTQHVDVIEWNPSNQSICLASGDPLIRQLEVMPDGSVRVNDLFESATIGTDEFDAAIEQHSCGVELSCDLSTIVARITTALTCKEIRENG